MKDGRIISLGRAVALVALCGHPALAQGVDDGGLVLAPLIVTGERVARTVFDTPSSVVVVTGEEIEQTPGVKDVSDVLEGIPNVTSFGAPDQAPAIRGVDTTGVLQGAGSFLGGARPRATITVDGRPLSYNEFLFGATSAFDLERVEVFRGPQTTAQGANSIAGAIYVVTADPTFEPEVRGQVEAGDYRGRRVSAVASGPLIENELAARIAVDYQAQDSYLNFVTTEDYTDLDPNEFENVTLRGKLLWEPAAMPGLSAKLTLNRAVSEGPQGELAAKPFFDLNSYNENQAIWRNAANSAILDVSYAFGSGWEFSNRFSATDIRVERYAVPGQGVAQIDESEYVNEATLRWESPDARLSVLLGTYYQLSDADETSDFTAFIGFGDFTDRQSSLGVFGEATYALTERLDLTAGLRYQRDGQDRDGTFGPFVVDFDRTFDSLLPKFALGYDLTSDLRIGAIASRGFNPGGTTISFATGAQDTFEAETVWNYELFGRAFLLDDRLALEGNLFYEAFRDFQRETFTGFDPFGNPEFEIDNADRARSYGLELSAQYQATDDLLLAAGLGLLRTEITAFSSSADPDIVGSEFSDAPHATFSLGVEYEVVDALVLGGRLRYSDSYFSDDDNTPAFEIDSYTVVDLQASYAFQNVEAYAYVNNAFDNEYLLSRFDDAAVVGAPREFGAGLRVVF